MAGFKMREETIKLYQYDELSEEAKERAIQDWRENQTDYIWAEDGVNSLKAFCKAFDIELKDYSLCCGNCTPNHISFNANNYDMQADSLVGIRAFKYLHNNYANEIENFWQAKVTGYCFDCDIIKPLVDFMKRPDAEVTLQDLYQACFDAFCTAWYDDIEYQNSDEYISETLQINEYEFTEDGKVW